MKVLSLFSGIGGFDLAFRNLGHEIIGACEIDEYARRVYGKHFPGVTIHNDASTLSPDSLPQFDVLCAGFPCQAFSIAGKRRGFKDTRGSLFFEIARIAKEKKPRYLLLENVKGLLSHDKGETFRTIIRTLDEVGYDAEWQLLNSKYHVPQNRERLFIIGHLRGERTRQVFPLGDYDQKTNKKINYIINSKHQQKRVIGIDSIASTLQTADTGLYAIGNILDKTSMIYISNTNANMKQREQERDNTLTLSTNSNEFGLKDGVRIRRLTPVECERLQGFPDNWTKYGVDGKEISDTQRYKMCGNAVTVDVIEYIAKNLT
jgi:DNA (cytosine-5)-methyltransferase 1